MQIKSIVYFLKCYLNFTINILRCTLKKCFKYLLVFIIQVKLKTSVISNKRFTARLQGFIVKQKHTKNIIEIYVIYFSAKTILFILHISLYLSKM